MSNKLALGAGRNLEDYSKGQSRLLLCMNAKLISHIHHSFFSGCYWGTEKFVVKDFQKSHPGVIRAARVGFMATDPHNPIRNPDYRAVCSGRTGYVEVLLVELNDPATFEALIRFFFQFHDPTTKDRQGNDTGPQYASVIFCDDEAQMGIARRVKSELLELVRQGKIGRYFLRTVETKILPTTNFVEAHAEHQEYLEKIP